MALSKVNPPLYPKRNKCLAAEPFKYPISYSSDIWDPIASQVSIPSFL